MEPNHEWERIKKESKELKGAAGTLIGFLIFAVAMLAGVWAFVEVIFNITLTLLQALLITSVLGLIYLWRVKNEKIK